LAIKRPGRRAVQPALHALLELPPVEGEEVRALPALDVDDLQVLAGLDGVAAGRGGVHAQVEDRVGQRRRQDRLPPAERDGPAHLQQQVGRGVGLLVVHPHHVGRRRHQDDRLAHGREALARSGGRPVPEQPRRPQRVRRGAAGPQLSDDLVGDPAGVGARDQGPHRRRRHVELHAERRPVAGAVRQQDGHLGRLPSLAVHHRQPVPGLQPDPGHPAGPDPVGLQAGSGASSPGSRSRGTEAALGSVSVRTIASLGGR
jgi:hypothetical protein